MAKTETGVQLFARLGNRPTLEGLEPSLFGEAGPLKEGVYEVYGLEGTGKSELILYLVMKAILPKQWKHLDLGGKGVSVIFIDTEYKFSILRLAAIMESHILKINENYHRTKSNLETRKTTLADDDQKDISKQELSADEVEGFIKECLKKLRILQPSNSFQFLMTLYLLESTLSNDPEVSLLVIDTISAYYWMDRSCSTDTMMEHNMKKITKVLKSYLSDYGLVLLVVKAALVRKKNRELETWEDNSSAPTESAQSEKRLTNDVRVSVKHLEFLGVVWSNFVKHRLIVSKSLTPDGNTLHKITTKSSARSSSVVKYHVDDSGVHFY